MDNKILPSPGSHDIDSFAAASRKRKSRSRNIPEATSEFQLPRKSSLKQDSLFHGTRGRGNTVIYQTVISESPTFNCWDGFSDTSLNRNVNFPGIENGSTNHLPSTLPAQSSQHGWQPPPIKVPSGETFEVPNCIDQECHSYTQSQDKGLSFAESSIADTGKPQVGPVSEDVSSLTNNDDISIKLPLEMYDSSSKFLIPVRIPQLKNVDGFSEKSSGGADNLNNSCEMNHHGQHSGNAGISNQPSGQDCTRPSAYPEEKQKHRSMELEVQHSLGVSADNTSQRGGHGRSNCKLNESESADDENQHHSLRKKVSNPGSILASSDRHEYTSGMSQKLDECRLPCGKSSSMGSEKLWDGSIQLNSSITMSAIAFFKSGERLVDINWSKSVEVKGKVRLDAFEKYIQDLPRARTRGLMVISLCAKDGSSDKELKRMKEVAKAYRKGERVAFAHFTEGVDLYLCPQSEKIFTILAKGGFFKGMTAVEGKSDAFIGCVVWRKSVENKKNRDNYIKMQSQKSPSDSSNTQRSGESSMSPLQPILNALSLVAVTPSSAVESINVVDRKAVISNSSGANLSTTPPPARSSIAVVQQGSRHLNLSSQTSKGLPLGRQASSVGFSVPDQHKASLGLPNMPISLPANVKKQMLPTTADDDLPEYDFGTARGIAFASAGMPIDVPVAGMRLQTERIKTVDGTVLPGMPVRHSVSASNRRTDNLSNPRHSSNLPMSVADHEPQSHVSGKLENQHSFEKYATPAAASTTSYALPQSGSNNLSKRNLFSDHDDDMPEWLPPQHQMPPLVKRHKPSSVMPSETSASIFQNQQVLGRQLLHSPLSAAVRPEFSFQGFPGPHLPPAYFRFPSPMLSQSDPSSWTGFQCDRALRPVFGSFVANPTVRPADGRYWRP